MSCFYPSFSLYYFTTYLLRPHSISTHMSNDIQQFYPSYCRIVSKGLNIPSKLSHSHCLIAASFCWNNNGRF